MNMMLSTMNFFCSSVTIMLLVISEFAATDGATDVICVGRNICLNNKTGERFTCLTGGKFDCCEDSDRQIKLFVSRRGTGCCHGAGMFDIQTHDCVKTRRGNQIVLRQETKRCATGRTTVYNSKSQICCASRIGKEPTVYLKESGYSCCGSEYINNAGRGCCEGVPYDKTTKCCKNSSVLDKYLCDENDDMCNQDCSSSSGSGSFVPTERETYYVYAFKAGRHVETDEAYNYYRVKKFAKQLKGRKRKVATVNNHYMKRIGIPKCSCLKTLQEGKIYVLITKSNIRSKEVRLGEQKYSLSSVESSDAFLKLFSL